MQSIERAYHGQQAVEVVQECFEKGEIFGLILTDISMPIMDGFESSEKIRAFYRRKKIPQPMIVACTGHVEEEFIQKAWLSQIDQVLAKPINQEMLQGVFDEIV